MRLQVVGWLVLVVVLALVGELAATDQPTTPQDGVIIGDRGLPEHSQRPVGLSR